jgi:hypothetical protein
MKCLSALVIRRMAVRKTRKERALHKLNEIENIC